MADQHEPDPDPDRSDARCGATSRQSETDPSPEQQTCRSAPALETPSSCVHSAPSGEGSSLLLSLPWEVLLHVTSYLPARIVVDVLPQVCRLLRALASDRLTWKVRAQRRLHPAGGGTFPLLETPDFDWPAACLELEEHLSHWSDEGGGAERFSLTEGHFASVESVLLLNGGTVCASGSRDRNVVLWDLRRLGEGAGEAEGEGEGEGGAQVSTLLGNQRYSTHRGWVWCLAARGSLLCSGSFDSTIKTWDLGACGAPLSEIRGRDAVLCLSCLSDVVVAGSFDKRVSVYDPRCAEPLLQSLELHARAVLTLSADERHIVSGSEDRSLAVFDRRAGKLLQRMQLSSYLLSLCPQPPFLWAGDNQGELHALRWQDGLLSPLGRFDVGHRALLTGVQVSLGTLYTCATDKTLKVHVPSDPPKTLCTVQHQEVFNGISVEGGVLAAASGDMSVEIWKMKKSP
ncbi:F-box/WD repeat-containing protein 9-like isoform X3 [Acipenser ruthenus]|uniref:F-box/WD repeat-containing protein 9-like isoform X3 n=1 Tax=Acipenser ruthenus TaxID=7906 RepID=UPI00274150A5|nr:F-box/WD repeat-containing protein 9-like isoform X3 [Acipenser ruthenus]